MSDVPKKCSVEGCDGPVMAKGLCSTHYQRQRREGLHHGQVGRPREYPSEISDKHHGAPKLTVRLEPELSEWVRGQGGGAWLRHVARELRRLSAAREFERWWEELRLPDQ